MSSLSEFITAFVNPGPHNPWRELWTRVLALGPWARYPEVYEHEREYCAYCGAWAPEHEPGCPYLLAELLEESDEPGALASE